MKNKKWLCYFGYSGFHLADYVAVLESVNESNAKTAAIKEWESADWMCRDEVTAIDLEEISLPWSRQ